MLRSMKYKDTQISFNSSNRPKRKTVAKFNATRGAQRSSNSENEDGSYYELRNASSTILKKDDFENNDTEQMYEKAKRKQAWDFDTSHTSLCSSEDDDLLCTSSILSKRKRVYSSDIPSCRRKRNTLPMIYSEEDCDSSKDYNDDDSHAKSQGPIVPDVRNTKETNSPGFQSCLIQVLDNIKNTFSTYESRLCHLKKKYFENDSTDQDDMENVIFIFSCIMSKLKDDLDKEENSLKRSYHSCQKQWHEHSSITKKQLEQMDGGPGSRNNEVIIINDKVHDAIPPEVQGKSTLPDASKDVKQLEAQKETKKHTEFSDSGNSSTCHTLSKEKKTPADIDASTKNAIAEIPSLTHLTEITIVNTSKTSNNFEGNYHCVKPSTMLNSVPQKTENMVPRRRRCGYDSDISTCSTIICRKSSKRGNKSRTNTNLVSQRYGTPKSEILTKFNTTPKKRKRAYMISDIDCDSTGSEDDYHLQLSLEKSDSECGLQSNRKTAHKKTTPLKLLGSQIFRRTSPVLVDINLINDPDHMYSEDEVDEKRMECYIAQKHNKNLIQSDIKLQMKCVVEISKLK